MKRLAEGHQTDEELLRQVQQRDSVAFEVLLKRYQSPLHRHVISTLRDGESAHDIVQEVFLRVWTRAESWHEQGSCRAWLYRIATNLALNQLRTLNRRREQPLVMQTATTEDDEELPVPGWLVDTVTCNPQTALERAEQRRLLDELVNSLPKGKRDVVRLIHEEELDSREVARLLAIPEGTVRSRLHHARKSLAQLWEAHAPDTD